MDLNWILLAAISKKISLLYFPLLSPLAPLEKKIYTVMNHKIHPLHDVLLRCYCYNDYEKERKCVRFSFLPQKKKMKLLQIEKKKLLNKRRFQYLFLK